MSGDFEQHFRELLSLFTLKGFHINYKHRYLRKCNGVFLLLQFCILQQHLILK